MEKNIAVIKGDGIGPEIVTESMKVLDKVAEKFGHKFNYTQLLMGGCSIDANGVPLTDETIAACKASDAVLMGSIGMLPSAIMSISKPFALISVFRGQAPASSG